ncbi:MAG: hypothetical protein FWG89_10345 [Treponema sp.]|nr:hypothetical protein [Treponema sp.]
MKFSGLTVLFVACLFSIWFTACTPDYPYAVSVDKTELSFVFAEAAALKDTTFENNLDGDGLYPSVWYATTEAHEIFTAALDAARAVRTNPAATQSEVDDAIKILEAAIVIFRNACARTDPMDRSTLNAAIAEAEDLIDTLLRADNAHNLTPGQEWVLAADYDAFAAVIAATKIVSGNLSASQMEMYDALLNIESAPPPIQTAAALTGSVTITGGMLEGSTLTANVSGLGGLGTYTYQWKSDDNGTVTDVGTNNNTYTLQTEDIGSMITVTVWRFFNCGSVTSDPYGPITAHLPPALPVLYDADNGGWTDALGAVTLTTTSGGTGQPPYTYEVTNTGILVTNPGTNTNGSFLATFANTWNASNYLRLTIEYYYDSGSSINWTGMGLRQNTGAAATVQWWGSYTQTVSPGTNPNTLGIIQINPGIAPGGNGSGTPNLEQNRGFFFNLSAGATARITKVYFSVDQFVLVDWNHIDNPLDQNITAGNSGYIFDSGNGIYFRSRAATAARVTSGPNTGAIRIGSRNNGTAPHLIVGGGNSTSGNTPASTATTQDGAHLPGQLDLSQGQYRLTISYADVEASNARFILRAGINNTTGTANASVFGTNGSNLFNHPNWSDLQNASLPGATTTQGTIVTTFPGDRFATTQTHRDSLLTAYILIYAQNSNTTNQINEITITAVKLERLP